MKQGYDFYNMKTVWIEKDSCPGNDCFKLAKLKKSEKHFRKEINPFNIFAKD